MVPRLEVARESVERAMNTMSTPTKTKTMLSTSALFTHQVGGAVLVFANISRFLVLEFPSNPGSLS